MGVMDARAHPGAFQSQARKHSAVLPVEGCPIELASVAVAAVASRSHRADTPLKEEEDSGRWAAADPTSDEWEVPAHAGKTGPFADADPACHLHCSSVVGCDMDRKACHACEAEVVGAGADGGSRNPADPTRPERTWAVVVAAGSRTGESATGTPCWVGSPA